MPRSTLIRLRSVWLTVGLAGCSSAGGQGDAASVRPGATSYGVAAVPGDTLAAMRARCSGATVAAGASAGLVAECDQLLRTAHTQPGNSSPAAP